MLHTLLCIGNSRVNKPNIINLFNKKQKRNKKRLKELFNISSNSNFIIHTMDDIFCGSIKTGRWRILDST